MDTNSHSLQNLMVSNARKWVGIKEEGNNRGREVELFMSATPCAPAGSPWCMAFAQYVVKQVSQEVGKESALFVSGHCLTVWNESPSELRRPHAEIGCIAIWKMKGTTSGHAGIVSRVNGTLMRTIEGNTGPGGGIVREGDGVYEKSRSAYPYKGAQMELVGFLWPWRA